MASQVDICNYALTKLGEKRIISLSDNTPASNALSAIYSLTLDDLLRSYNWNFAIKRVQLAADSAVPAYDYTLQYTLPSDCLRVVQVGKYYVDQNLSDLIQSEYSPYVIEGKKILTDKAAPLRVRYVRRVTNSEEFDSTFVNAFACRLAMEIAEEITQSNTKRDLAARELKQAISTALHSDAIENPPQHRPDGSWMQSRYIT